jgi:hypothetical protein
MSRGERSRGASWFAAPRWDTRGGGPVGSGTRVGRRFPTGHPSTPPHNARRRGDFSGSARFSGRTGIGRCPRPRRPRRRGRVGIGAGASDSPERGEGENALARYHGTIGFFVWCLTVMVKIAEWCCLTSSTHPSASAVHVLSCAPRRLPDEPRAAARAGEALSRARLAHVPVRSAHVCL